MIKIGDKVRVTGNITGGTALVGEVGEVIRLYDSPIDLAIVNLESGVTTKISTQYLEKVEDTKNRENAPIPEGAREISEGEFKSAVCEIAAIENKSFSDMNSHSFMFNFIDGITTMIVGIELAKKLFADYDVVTLTKDQLTKIIWDACSPETVSENVKGQIPIDKCMSISISAIIDLRKLLDVFFPDGVKDA